MAYLILLEGENKGKRYDITGPRCVIGRAEGCDIVVPSGAVSLKHCELVNTEAGLFVRDLGSTNGTLVNEMPLNENTPLKRNDVLLLGSIHFMLAGDDLPSGEMTIRPGQPTVKVRRSVELADEPHNTAFTKPRASRRYWMAILTIAGSAALIAFALFILAMFKR